MLSTRAVLARLTLVGLSLATLLATGSLYLNR